jgi:hypothetical protein
MNEDNIHFDNNDIFDISASCVGDFPCFHRVTFRKSEVGAYMSGVDICELCLEHNLPIPGHFEVYLGFVIKD